MTRPNSKFSGKEKSEAISGDSLKTTQLENVESDRLPLWYWQWKSAGFVVLFCKRHMPRRASQTRASASRKYRMSLLPRVVRFLCARPHYFAAVMRLSTLAKCWAGTTSGLQHKNTRVWRFTREYACSIATRDSTYRKHTSGADLCLVKF